MEGGERGEGGKRGQQHTRRDSSAFEARVQAVARPARPRRGTTRQGAGAETDAPPGGERLLDKPLCGGSKLHPRPSGHLQDLADLRAVERVDQLAVSRSRPSPACFCACEVGPAGPLPHKGARPASRGDAGQAIKGALRRRRGRGVVDADTGSPGSTGRPGPSSGRRGVAVGETGRPTAERARGRPRDACVRRDSGSKAGGPRDVAGQEVRMSDCCWVWGGRRAGRRQVELTVGGVSSLGLMGREEKPPNAALAASRARFDDGASSGLFSTLHADRRDG